MINEPIMRRGLSPEGKIIRQKHQSSLLNDEFGVTSQPVHRKIEKDFLKENVKKLKEIQAKCRVQESRPITGNYPFKALRVKPLQNPPICNNDKNNPSLICVSKSSVRERSGSTHSDYFSQTDEAPNDLNEMSVPQSQENVHSYNVGDDTYINNHLTTDDVTETQKNVVEEKLLMPLPPFSACSSPLIELPASNLENENSLSLQKSFDKAKISTDNHLLANIRKNDKLVELIEKIKNKKPACDTQPKNLWKEIEKQHKVLLGVEENLSICTPRSSVGSCKSIMPSRISKPVNDSYLSQSLDRINNQRQSQRLNRLDQNTSINISMSSDNISLMSSSCKPNRDKCQFTCRGEKSFPELNESSELKKNKYFFASNPELLSDNGCPENCLYERGSSLSSSQIVDDKLPATASFAPIIAKKESALPIYKQNILAKQRSLFLRSKSSGNLRITGEPPPTYKRGHVPKYLLARKVETQRMLEAAAAIDPLCPPGHTPLPDHERKNTLLLLKKGLADVVQQLSSLPIAQDTLRLRKVKHELDIKLNQIEEGIQIFSQPKVYVLNDS